MKAILNRLELLSLAKAADSIAPNLAAMDALKGVLLEAADDGKVTVAATNLEVALERRMSAEILQPGQLVLNARLVADMLELLGGETVTISGEDGKRVEIMEVESKLYQCSGVEQAIVRPFTDEEGLSYMIAYIVPKKNDLKVSQVRRELAENLMPFMIPEFIVKMPQIPLNSNGKPDMTRMPVVMKEGKTYEAID